MLFKGSMELHVTEIMIILLDFEKQHARFILYDSKLFQNPNIDKNESLIMLFANRQGKSKGTSLVLLTYYPDFPSMLLNELLAQEQTESGTFLIFGAP